MATELMPRYTYSDAQLVFRRTPGTETTTDRQIANVQELKYFETLDLRSTYNMVLENKQMRVVQKSIERNTAKRNRFEAKTNNSNNMNDE